MKVSDYVAHFLARRRVPFVFEMSGGMITHLLDSIHRVGATGIISVHHEQSAAFAADAVGRLTGIPGVAMATSGPGATNLLTGVGSCHFDSSPAVFITGQVNRYELKGERAIRQLGFQETDIVSMARPITKAAWAVAEAEEVPEALSRAFSLAVDGRPGPVLLDLPMDIQRADIEERYPEAPAAPVAQLDPAFLEELGSALQQARRPLIVAGGGIQAAGCRRQLQELAERLDCPIVHSLMAVDVLPYGHPLRAGMLGSYGNRWTNLAIGESDLLLVLGSRLDIRQTGADTAGFKGSRQVFHVDCEAGELNNRLTGCRTIEADLRLFFDAALSGLRSGSHPEWLREIRALREQWPDVAELSESPGINPNQLMHDLSRISTKAAAFVVDVGQHQMWAAQSLELQAGQRFLTSGGMGAMGFALPASVGAALACAPRPVVVVAGDGGFQTNLQELQTVVRNRLPVKMVVLNNGCHGMVRQFQESYFDSRYQSTLWGYSAPDFVAVAKAYGIPAASVEEPEKLQEALASLWADPGAPALLEVKIDTFANAYPKIAFGRPMTQMEPFFTAVAMEST